jgi:hypothetical protein
MVEMRVWDVREWTRMGIESSGNSCAASKHVFDCVARLLRGLVCISGGLDGLDCRNISFL